MAEVPRYGTHNNIKYSPRRTLVRWCIICDNPYHPNGRRDKVCSEECRDQKTYNNNFKNNHKYPSTYQPATDDDERMKRNLRWKMWYNNLTYEQRQRYNAKKKRNNNKVREDTHEDEYASIQAEMEALGLR